MQTDLVIHDLGKDKTQISDPELNQLLRTPKTDRLQLKNFWLSQLLKSRFGES